MSQEYLEDKEIAIMPMSSKKRLLEALLILTVAFSCYLMICLLSFDSSDPGWTQTAWHEPIRNYGGRAGAWLADTLLSIFGIMAYVMPVVIVGLCTQAWRFRNQRLQMDYFAIGIRLIGALSLVITTCGLAAINADDIWNFPSGGIIGNLVSTALTPLFDTSASILSLLCIWVVGFTLYTGWSWLTVAEKIGLVVIDVFARLTHFGQDPQDPSRDTEALVCAPETASSLVTDTQEPIDVAQTLVDPDDILLTPRRKATEAAIIPRSMTADSAKSTQIDPYLQYSTQVNPPLTDSLRQTDTPENGTALTEAHTETLDNPVIADPVTINHRLVTDAISHEMSGNSLGNTPAELATVPDSVSSNRTDIANTNTILGSTVPQASPQSAFALAASMGKLSTSGVYAGQAKQTVSFNQQAAVSPEIASSDLNRNPQVKQGIGPELPRPNPVRIPTRRELASYGIKLPSEREAEQAQKKSTEMAAPVSVSPVVALRQGEQSQASEPVGMGANTAMSGEITSASSQEMKAVCAAQGPTEATPHPTDSFHELSSSPQSVEIDDEQWQQQELARQFAEQQQQRYAQPEPVETPTPTFSQSREQNSGYGTDWPPNASSFTEGFNQSKTTPVSTETAAPALTASSQRPEQGAQPTPDSHDSLFHPFLVRHEQPLQKPSTPLPVLDLLTQPPAESAPIDLFALEQTGKLVEARLNDFRVKAEVVGISPGPVITRFELDLAPGVKAARISNLSRDLARSLSAVAVRVVEVIPGKPYVGLELPNQHRQTVYLREVLDCPEFRDNPSPLTIVLGKDISGQPVVADLAKMPHLLVAGTTGSGKSVGVNAMILSMLYKATPDDVRFIMIDPKMLELSVYEGIPHLLTEVVTDMKDAANALRWSVTEMERRYKLMSALGVRNLAGYNDRIAEAEAMGRPIPDPFWKPSDSMDTFPPVLEKLPYIVVMVDEFADLMMAVGKKVEELIARLAQKARAAGIHLVLATQRPSVDVITGLIKANIPTRIAFTVSSKIDSRTIIDQSGAESLLGMGDMLYMPPNSSMPVRVHGAFVRDQEVHAVVQDWKARGRPQYIESITAGDDSDNGSASGDSNGEDLDPLFDQAVLFVVEKRRASISGVQRQFRIGYNRAARIIEQMEAQGIVSEPGHNGNREVLSPPPHEL